MAWVLPALLVAALTVGAIRVSTPGRREAALDRLIPLEPGTTWVYRTRTNGRDTGLHVQQVTGPALLVAGGEPASGLVLEHFWEDFLGGGPFTSVAYLGRRDDVVLGYGSRSRGEFTENEPAIPLYRLPLTAGRSWEWEGTSADGTGRITFEVSAAGPLRVAGVSFDGCSRIHVEERTTDQSGQPFVDIADEWVCPGVGTVRVHEEAPTVGVVLDQELMEFHGLRRNLVSPEGGLPETDAPVLPPAPGWVPGVDQGRTNHVPGAALDAEHLAWSFTRRLGVLYPPVGRDGLLVLAEDDGTVSALDTRTGRVPWQVQLEGPTVAPPVLAGPVALVAAGAKSLFALDAETGETRWVAAFPDLVAGPPLVVGATAVVVTEDGGVRALRLHDGTVAWEAGVDAVVTAPAALSGDTVVVAERGGDLFALSPTDGSSRWSAEMDAALGAGPVAGEGTVVAADETGVLYGFDLEDGDLRWRLSTDGAVDVAPAMAGDRVAVVSGRFLQVRDVADGRELWRARLPELVEAAPMVLGEEVVVLGVHGNLERRALSDGRLVGATRVPAPPAVEASTGLDMAYVDGALVVPVEVSGSWPFAWLLAYPAPSGPGQDVPTDGVRFEGEVRPAAATSVYPPSLSGPDVIAAGYDQTAWRIQPGGPPRTLLASDAPVPFAIPAGRVILTQDGDRLVAVPRRGGAPVWSFPMGEPFLVTAPAVAGDVVVVPQRGRGLAGVDLGTGEQRWARALPTSAGTTAPLALPDGGVAYASGGLHVLEPATGRVRWTIEGIDTFAPLAAGDGAVVVQGFGPDGAGLLLSVDARTGEERWRVPFPPVPFIGPAAGEGMVVAFDGEGRVTGFDAATGEPRWSLPVRTPLNGSPGIVGDRVVLAEQGRWENVSQRDFRLTVVDLATGRFLASFELAGSSFLPGGFGVSGDVVLTDAVAHRNVILVLRMVGA